MSNVHYIQKFQRHDAEQMELLVSKEVDTANVIPRLSQRIKLLMMLFVIALLSAAGCAFTMASSGYSLEAISILGLDGGVGSLLVIMVFCVLLFTTLLVAYAGVQMFSEYRSVYDPKHYPRSRKRREA